MTYTNILILIKNRQNKKKALKLKFNSSKQKSQFIDFGSIQFFISLS